MVHLYCLGNKTIEIILCILCGYFVFIKILLLSGSKISIIFSDFWNWVEYLSLTLLIIYLVFEMRYQDEYKHLNFLLAIVNLVSWIQGLSRLRAFRQTRIFIHLVKQVIYQMTSFVIVLIGSILALSTTYAMLDHDPTNDADLKGDDF